MNVLGIETSCDETAAAVVSAPARVRSSVVFSQVALHRPYGGVVPEIASRSHVENLPATIGDALAAAALDWSGVDAVAATYGPGLASSLLVGLSAGKALAMRLAVPLVAVNHLEAHIVSVFLADDAPPPEDVCPFVCLVVSGGHTALVRVESLGRYTVLGQTIDDAAGEAFDKGANLLGLGYPGGPAVDREASRGDPCMVRFPRSGQRKLRRVHVGLDPALCFSFSGVKTALLYYLRDNPVSGEGERASVAASYQEAIVDALVDRCSRALRGERFLAAVGGVSLNSRLRAKLGALAKKRGLGLLLAPPKYCADNAAMIAAVAGFGQGVTGRAAAGLDVAPSLPLVD